MDQVDTLDFQALRARFQEEEHLLKPMKIRPTPPEKPRVASPPQSPTYYLPAGARPSLLSSISQSLERGSATTPRVIFKEDKKEAKKEAKKPFIQFNSKGGDSGEGKLKKGKDKMKGSRENLDEGWTDRKQKGGKEKKLPKELVPAAPPPSATVSKRKGFLTFKKSPKRNSVDILSAESIMDSPRWGGPGLAPLIPAPLIPAPLVPAPLVPAPLVPAPLIPAPLIPAPLIPAPLVPAPLVPAPLVPAPLIPAPLIPAPLVPAPLVPAPLIPAPLIPAPLIPAPLIPPPFDFGVTSVWPGSAAPRALPNVPSLPDSAVEVIPASPDFTPPPAFIPDAPAPEAPTPQSETPLEIETPSLPIYKPARWNQTVPPPPHAASTPPPSPYASTPPLVASTPSLRELDELVAAAEAAASVKAVNIAEVEAPPPSLPAATDLVSNTPSPKAERPPTALSALSALSRVEVLNPGKKTSSSDHRIFNALEKARRKISPPTNPSMFSSVTPPPEVSLTDLQPIDYTGNARPSKPVNGFDPRQAVLEGIDEEGSHAVPELLVVPTPTPLRRVLPHPESLGPTPKKPSGPPPVHLAPFIPPSPLMGDIEIPAPPEFSEDLPEFQSEWWSGKHAGPDTSNGPNLPELFGGTATPPGAEVHAAMPAFGDVRVDPEPEPSSRISQESPGLQGVVDHMDNGFYESTDDVYEAVSTSTAKKKGKSDGGRKHKGTLKNPYAVTHQITNEEKSRTARFGKNVKKAEEPDEKELKKKEKQRLEKEKKELKEKQDREKKEQKEREKKENEMKKKFKITGQEDAMYQAKVTVTNKGRKNNLPVTSGDVVSIIRTTSCPKGKWLARDGANKCGYIVVNHVELDIKEMLELGKKAANTRLNSSNHVIEEEDTQMGSRVSSHFPMTVESFTDDSEEWTADDEEPLTPAPEPEYPQVSTDHARTLSTPDVGNNELSLNHAHSRSDVSADSPDVQARHQALHKLATFFHSPKPKEPAAASHTEPETSPVLVKEEEVPFHTEPETSPVLVKEEEVPVPAATSTQDFNLTDMIILPPPDLYADFSVE